MAKVGYIFKKEPYEDFNEDKNWMLQFGCVNVVEEQKEHEKLRPKWKQLLSSLERGDELVVTKFSNAVRGSRELASLIELCRIKVVRIISVHDKIDTKNILFPDTKYLMLSKCSVHYRKNAPHYVTHHRISYNCSKI